MAVNTKQPTLALMTKEAQLAFKQQLKQFAEQQLQQRITVIREKMEAAQQSANNEEKSSAGDKYETSRAMNHLEKEMHGKQLAENLKELSLLYEISVSSLHDKVIPGTVVQCKAVCFFIAAGLGKQTIANTLVIFLSPHAPLAAQLRQKQVGDTWEFNKQLLTIEAIF
ncbi:transcription elongation GreA/GreB family factor [Filimonas zeae]|uniref:3-oxoacyl-ACP synthase n=2 Tax=Filimonas zeae TaxID=1737353 RepID=A0A917IRY0_9BACT|nr:hypothetical protein [Filimonas zeae]MDR6337923.1 transcription elongation GreA/GreB family factor [Filimonas zeae]GGH60887.1 hypothetical protein GCM10011379_09250 [Filimonas zeae]